MAAFEAFLMGKQEGRGVEGSSKDWQGKIFAFGAEPDGA